MNIICFILNVTDISFQIILCLVYMCRVFCRFCVYYHNNFEMMKGALVYVCIFVHVHSTLIDEKS